MLKTKKKPAVQPSEPIRLQKFLAMAGIASRRASEKMIEDGKVKVNGRTVHELGTKVDPKSDAVTVSGKPVKIKEQKLYFLFYKPTGCLTTVKDDKDRTTIFHYLKGIKETVFPVGRLDYNTEGLLIITNDGELAHALNHPSYKVDKTYVAKVSGIPKDTKLKKLEQGIVLEDGVKTAPLKATLARTTGKNAWLRFQLREGKNRQIRKMCERIGHPVSKLKRIEIGGLGCAGLSPGTLRPLEPWEVSKLRRLVAINPKQGQRKKVNPKKKK